MPTDALIRLREVMIDARDYGFEKVRQEQISLGQKVRALFENRCRCAFAVRRTC